MKNNLLYLLILVLLCPFCSIISQQTPVFSDYIYNTILINPAHAGFYQEVDITAANRGSFNQIEGSPQNLSFTTNIPFSSKKVGLGAGFTSDQIGVTSINTFFASYAYKVIFNDDYTQSKSWNYNPTVISFGIMAGVSRFDEDLLSLNILNDPNFESNINTTIPTIGVGFLYNKNRIYVGISATNLLGDTFSSEENINLETPNYLYGGYRFFLNTFQEIMITPNFLINYVSGAPLQIDLNMIANYKNKIQIGAGFRTNSSVNFFAGFYALKHFRILFNYTANIVDAPINNSLGVLLSYRLGEGFSRF